MSHVLPFISFGLTIVAGGIYWATWDACREYLDDLVLNDVYYTLMRTIWAWIPAIILIVAVLCLIVAGTQHSRSRREVY